MKNKRRGFTLIELLAVIVILGLLMAIAIPSVTKYITESRKKTVVSTIGNYIGALVNDVNDLTYTFTEANTIYAVPIECIALERGGTNPFGEWHQANNAYWAYVLVQYDDETSSYRYGYTFKDSAGYGLYPTSQAKLNEQGKQIQTGLSLSRPKNGKVTTITELKNWNGFVVNDTTNLVVLEAASEGEVGDGKSTCTLCQKGKNYDQIKNDNQNTNNTKTLASLIVEQNTLINAKPNLDSDLFDFDVSGLYSSDETTNGQPTYYFRGNVTNNNVDFAGLKWKIIRINEDGTIRLILDGRIGDSVYAFNSTMNRFNKMYYSESDAKTQVDNWYQDNIMNKGYSSYVSNGIFCEQAKVKGFSGNTSGNATMTMIDVYEPNFDCDTDGNGKGIVKNEDGTLLKVGLITYDEAKYAGSTDLGEYDYYLQEDYDMWTMSPGGFYENYAAKVWYTYASYGDLTYESASWRKGLRPVINLKSDVLATGTGTSLDPYVIQTK